MYGSYAIYFDKRAINFDTRVICSKLYHKGKHFYFTTVTAKLEGLYAGR